MPQLLVLVVSLATTGHGEAFLRLKVLSMSLHGQCLLALLAHFHTEAVHDELCYLFDISNS